MSTDAVVMFVVGALLLWGGLAVSVLVYVRAARREREVTAPGPPR